MKNKYCKRCDKTRLIKFFTKDRNISDGYCFYCKECRSKIQKNYIKSNRDKYIEYIMNYQKNSPKYKLVRKRFDTSPNRIEKRKKYYTKYYREGDNCSKEQVLTERNIKIYEERNLNPFNKQPLSTKEVRSLKSLSIEYNLSEEWIRLICIRVHKKILGGEQ
jgi:hypothetical protein